MSEPINAESAETENQATDLAADAQDTQLSPVSETKADSPAVKIPRPSPAALAHKTPSVPLVPIVPVSTSYDDAEVAAAQAFGEVREDGVITVQDGPHTREIGSVGEIKAGEIDESTKAQALIPHVHAYLDLKAFLETMELKLQAPQLAQVDVNRVLEQVRKNMKDLNVVGDIPALRQKASEVREKAKEIISKLEAEKAQLREAALKERTQLVESVEALANTDSPKGGWKIAGEKVRGSLDEWKSLQKAGPALAKNSEDELWKRLSNARNSFERRRRTHFSELEAKQVEATKVKTSLIEKAEAIKDSDDYGKTIREFRDLMEQWKKAPRGNRKKEDQLWAKFKAAQDAFYERRNADLAKSEAEQQENLAKKEALIEKAEALLPIKDLEKTKLEFAKLEDQIDAIGFVPRNHIRRVENRLKAIQDAIREAEQAEWRRTDPATKARVEGASSQLQAAIASYEEDLEKAIASKDEAKIAKAQAALDARREWLAVIERSAKELD